MSDYFENLSRAATDYEAVRLRVEEQREDILADMRKLEEQKAHFRDQFAARLGRMIDPQLAKLDSHFKFCYDRLLMDAVQFDMFDFIAALRVVRRISYEPAPQLRDRVDDLNEEYDWHGDGARDLVDREAPQSAYELLLQLQDFYGYPDRFATVMINTIAYFTDTLRETYSPARCQRSAERVRLAAKAPDPYQRPVYRLLAIVDTHTMLLDHYLDVVYPA
jgi:hypothetical protein